MLEVLSTHSEMESDASSGMTIAELHEYLRAFQMSVTVVVQEAAANEIRDAFEMV